MKPQDPQPKSQEPTPEPVPAQEPVPKAGPYPNSTTHHHAAAQSPGSSSTRTHSREANGTACKTPTSQTTSPKTCASSSEELQASDPTQTPNPTSHQGPTESSTGRHRSESWANPVRSSPCPRAIPSQRSC